MAQSIQHDQYPKFVADQVLTEKSLNQMFGYLEEQQRLTRTTLIGIGIMCGLKVRVSEDGNSITITEGVGVTSKGYLVPFPEQTFPFYNDQFSAEQDFMYPPFIDAGSGKQKFPLYLLHNNGAAEIKKPVSAAFLAEKAVLIFVELLKIDNKNCDPDTCDDKGCTVEVTHRPLLIDLEHLDELILSGPDNAPFLAEPACVEWPEIKMPRYNVPATKILSSTAVLKNFLDLLNNDFILQIEQVLSAAYSSFGYYLKDEFPNNPFSGLKSKFKFLYDGSLSLQQLLFVQYYYDFFSDLILAYQELREICNDCLSVCCPNEDLFPRHLILGNAIPSPDEYRHHWIQSPAFACTGCSEGKISFLLKKIILMVSKLNIPGNIVGQRQSREQIRITPSQYGDLPLSDKAIPYYYDIVNPPSPLFDHWNFKKSKLKKGNTNLSYYAANYNGNSYFNTPLNYDIEPFNFFRIEGHLGLNWKQALTRVKQIKNEKRLPFDVIALNSDLFEMIRSLLTSSNRLSEIMAGDREDVRKLHCYFADIEAQYDVQAAELRCRLLKIMTYFYNLRRVGLDENLTPTTNIPQSDLIRQAFPNYRTFANSYGEEFDSLYQKIKDQPYITPQAFISTRTFSATNQSSLLSPAYLMYYLEKIHEVLPDGLVQLEINDLTQRLKDASNVAALMLVSLDNAQGFELPALWEESLDDVIRICKANVFEVIYKNFLINYALFISNQSFAMYAMMNSGVQHKAGVTTGGTFILVYNDNRNIESVNQGERPFETNSDNFNSVTAERPAFTGRISSNVNVRSLESENTINAVNESATAGTFGRYKNPILEYKKELSVKAVGLNKVFDLVDAQRAEDKLSDADLKELTTQLPDGIVIADFFVPNMCKSDCMPMNYIVMDDEEPPPGETRIRLEMKYREFCEDDQSEYDILTAPEGGTLKIDDSVNNDFKFKPVNYPVENDPSREIAISYELNENIKTIRVRVYNRPEINISIKSQDHANRSAEFNNVTEFADRYAWDFGNGQFSDQRDPGPISFSDTQTAVVILRAFNGPCESESQPLTVRFEEQPPEKRTCLSVEELAERFGFFEEIAPEELKKELESYPGFRTVFIEKIDELANRPQEEQCKLLTGEIKVSDIQKTVRALNQVVRNNKELRRPALLFFEAMLKLTMFLACCQNKDVNEARVKTETTLNAIIRLIKSWPNQVDFSDEEKVFIENMLEAVKNEAAAVANGTPPKPVYLDLLNELESALSVLMA